MGENIINSVTKMFKLWCVLDCSGDRNQVWCLESELGTACSERRAWTGHVTFKNPAQGTLSLTASLSALSVDITVDRLNLALDGDITVSYLNTTQGAQT